MFPGLELTNDDNGVNVRPLPLLEQDRENLFFVPHTYHVISALKPASLSCRCWPTPLWRRSAGQAGDRGAFRYDLPLFTSNADLLLGIGEKSSYPANLFGPDPKEIYQQVSKSLAMRQMAHTAEDLCEKFMPPKELARCKHDDVRHGFILAFDNEPPDIDLAWLEERVKESIAADLPVCYLDEEHITIDGQPHPCTGPRTMYPVPAE